MSFWVGYYMLYKYNYLCRPSCAIGLYCTVVYCRLAISLAHVEKFDDGHLM